VRCTKADALDLALRALVTVGLVVDAVVHLRLAAGYQLAQPAGIGQGNLFRIEAVIALFTAAYVLWRGSRPAFVLAAAVGLGGVVVVLVYRYVDVPGWGPVPQMYEPIWFFQKALSAVAEAAAAVLAIAGALRGRPDQDGGRSVTVTT
jgi:hypothetical protein